MEKDPANANAHSAQEARNQRMSGRMLALVIGGVLCIAVALYITIMALGFIHA
ncbi:hypothetical protein [Xaviernesmea oryzae]|uniref:hypothetical protein n=1 Tax=Xaviernesmea oryzae TaxID=464029 RepID=UPI0008C3192C|nr:hypothetical protein [Xaviernesmea oryzae]SEK45871.1 hypothetical protein SAMN04487976_102233 [Xaviernesmea oryzae]